MKRGLITWDRDEIAPEIFDARVERVRECARSASVPAVAIYTDVWRSNRARWVSNFMPYFNRSLLVVPVEDEPVLICGLSPRVYDWIRSVTVVDEIRPGKRPAERLLELASEKSWPRIGVSDYGQLPHEIYHPLSVADVEVVDVELPPCVDEGEIAMRRKALAVVRPLVESLELEPGEQDFVVGSRLERSLRRAGMEDLVLWFGQRGRSPRPADGTRLADGFSVIVAAEYRGHWVVLSRCFGGPRGRERFLEHLESFPGVATFYAHDLSGAHPFRAVSPSSLTPETIASLHLDVGDGLLYGDTCLVTGPTSATVL